MTKELHPVVELLLARMESHPEEFETVSKGTMLVPSDDRWWHPISRIMECGTEAEQAAIRAGLRKIKLDAAHEAALDELLNGDERRRKQAEDEANYAKMAQQTALSQAQRYNNQYANAQNALTNGALSAQPTWTTSTYTTPDTGAAGTYYETTAPTNTGTVAAIKKALGL